MCGRFALGPRAIARLDLEHTPDWVDEDLFVPRYNIAPHTYAPVIRRNIQGSLTLQSMRFGLVPHWAKSEDKKLNTINARSDNLSTGMWNGLRSNRCIIVAQGYFEWLKKGKDRIPHFIKHASGELMLLAGLFDRAHLEGAAKPIWSFTIITTQASPDLEWLHERQPVILNSKEAVNTWLNPRSKWSDELSKLVQPYTGDTLQWYPVPTEVGKVGNESPSFIQPVSQRKDGIEAMFANQSPEKRKRAATPESSSKRIKEDESSGDSTITPDSSSSSVLPEAPSTPKKEPMTPKKKLPASPRKFPATPTRSPKKPITTPGSPSKKITDFFKS